VTLNPPTPAPERPSAVDRELVVNTLRESCKKERLSLNTFAERVEAAYRARSHAQLEGLVVDLPERSYIGRAMCAAVGHLSRWTVRLEAAWREPRTPRLALPVEGTITLGRSRECDCVLSDQTVSRRHACLRHSDGAWFIRDLRSANGTRVNGWRVVDEVEVRPGDRITLGGVAYRLGPPQ
jgi:hypothetical protein